MTWAVSIELMYLCMLFFSNSCRTPSQASLTTSSGDDPWLCHIGIWER